MTEDQRGMPLTKECFIFEEQFPGGTKRIYR